MLNTFQNTKHMNHCSYIHKNTLLLPRHITQWWSYRNFFQVVADLRGSCNCWLFLPYSYNWSLPQLCWLSFSWRYANKHTGLKKKTNKKERKKKKTTTKSNTIRIVWWFGVRWRDKLLLQHYWGSSEPAAWWQEWAANGGQQGWRMFWRTNLNPP